MSNAEREARRQYDRVVDIYAALSDDEVLATEARTLEGQENIVAAFESALEQRGLVIVDLPPGKRLAV